MKNIRISDTINKWLLVTGILLMLSTLVLAGNNPENQLKTSPTPPGDPADPTGSINESGGPCGDKTLTRTDSPPLGEVWYWQTSYNGTSVTYDASTYTVSASGTYYLKAYKPSNQQWSTGYISKTVTINTIPATPSTPSVSNGCSGSVLTRGSAPGGVTWYWQSTSGGTDTSNSSSTYNVTGSGTKYLRAQSSAGCWSDNSASISYAQLPAPSAPAYTLSTNTCGNKTLSANNPPHASTNLFWKWQGKDSPSGTSQTPFTSQSISSSGNYYINTYDANNGCWSADVIISVTINPNPAIPASPTVQNNCGNTVVSYTAGQASGQNWHWQTSDLGTVTDPVSSTLSKTFTAGSTIYIRAKSAAGCWSTARTVSYTVNAVPNTPFDPTTNDTHCGNAVVEYDAIVANGKNWHWQATDTGTATDPVDQTLSKTFYSNGTIYVRAKSAQGCWSVAKQIDYLINPIPELASGPTQSRCGDGNITLTATPGTHGNDIKWYTAATGGTAVHTGTSYTFNLTADTTFYAASYHSTTFCEDTDRVAIAADWKAEPVLFTVGGGTTVCSGDAVSITLNGSASGTTYTLYRETISTGQSLNGTGSAISFDNQTLSGTYTIQADKSGCPATMTGSAVVNHLIVPTPDVPTVGNERCGPKTVTKVGQPPQLGPGGNPVYWYWMGTDPDNPNPTAFAATQGVTQTGSYYIRAQEGFLGQGGCWSAPILVNVTVDFPSGYPTNPDAGTISVTTNSCDAKTASTTQTLPAGQDFYWQGLSAATTVNTDPGSTSDPMTTGGKYYMRTRTAEGCFSDPVSFDVDNVTMRPIVKTLAGPTTNQYADTPVDYRKIRIDNSESHVEYKVQKNGVDIGNTFHGSGTTARSAIIMEDGDYTVVANRNGCETQMGETITIGSDTNENSGTSRSYTVPATNAANLPATLGEVLTATNYADGMGRPLQSVVKQVSPDQKDLVSFYEYDDLGRMPRQYLPFVEGTDGALKTDAKTKQTAFYQATGDHIANDTRPFSESTYEASPMNRMKKQFGVGEAWYTADNNAGRKATAAYATNTAAENIIIWQVVNDSLVSSGTYATGQLYKTTGTDEENHKVITYTNKVGQPILKKVQSGASTWAETYSVYDKRGRLRYVIPPLALEKYQAPGFGDPQAPYGFYLVKSTVNYTDIAAASDGKVAYTKNAVVNIISGDELVKGDIIQSYDSTDQVGQPADFHLTDLIFQYRYDHRHRLIEKRVPGADWVYLVYDDRDRLVLTQDGNQRTNNKWSFVKYDQLNRTILTGEKVISGTTAAIRTAVANATVFYETYDATGLMKYTNLAYPTGITADDIHTVTYYDNYDFTSQTFSLPTGVFTDLSNHRETPAQTTHALKGLATGAKTKVLGTTTFLETVNFYDDKYRVVQSVSENHKGGRDITTVQYNFAGQVMKTHVDHNPDGAVNNSTTIEQAYTYDHAGRSLTTTHSINGATPVTIASFTYNELGALENKALAGGFEDIDYEYNIRGWITQMNNPNDSEDHLFEMEFKYETATHKQYNGNIGEVTWKNPYESTKSSFDYTYDEMNRLKTADYDNTGTSTRDYGLESITYDANSNIKTLKRKGDHDDTANQSFDDLTYAYDGNQLMEVTDAASMSTGFDDQADDKLEYSYDANGNLKADQNKGITAIEYNHINQPTKVIYDAGKYIEYTYSASGAKVSQKVVENGQTTKTDYLGGFLYEGDSLQIIAHSQGRIVAERDAGNNFQGFEYQYHLTDHLGNVRVTFKTEIDTDTYEATMETENSAAESPYFYNLDTRSTHTGANHTSNGNEAARLDNSDLVGPAIALRVIPGDTIDMEVYAYYEGGTGYNNTVAVNTFISALASSFGGSSGAGGEAGSIFSGIDDAVTAGAGGVGGSGNDNVPAAYLSYILFDQNYKEVQNGYHEISSSANMARERLFLDDITVSEPGYLYIYTSMQSNVSQPVYFDDLKVSHTHSPVVQKSDYLAFGLEFNSYSRAAITAQNFKFNAGSEQEQMTGWYNTPFRKYDPSLGRFHGVDALADMYTGINPSHFGMNNPINFNDPTGLTVAPKSENQKQGAGGGTQHRHLPEGLGPNNARARWTSLYNQAFGNPNVRFAALRTMRVNHFVNKYATTLVTGASSLTANAISNFATSAINGTIKKGRYVWNKWAGNEVSSGTYEGAFLNTNSVEGRSFLSSKAYQMQKGQTNGGSQADPLYISRIDIDKTNQQMTLQWVGEGAEDQPTGPYKISTGKRDNTPSGEYVISWKYRTGMKNSKGQVSQHPNSLPSHPEAHWAVNIIGAFFIHTYPSVPDYPASAGCVRCVAGAGYAELIWRNVKLGTTVANLHGQWPGFKP